MRRLVTGTDAQGRSCVVQDTELTLVASDQPGFLAALVAAGDEVPPSRRLPGRAPTVDFGVRPGTLSWFITRYEPDLDFPAHRSDTVDYDLVLEGTLTLRLDDGDHRLEAGDVVVIDGHDHGWRAGPSGCLLSVMAIGASRPEGEGA